MLEAMFDLPVETLTLCAVLVFTLTEYFWKAYLSYRQRRIYRSTTCVPQELCNFEDPRTFAKLRIYHLEQSSFSFWFDLLSEIIWVLILLLGGIPFLWDVAGSMVAHLDLYPECEVHQSMVFLILTILLECLNELPRSVHHTLIGKKLGFKQQAFFVDVVKTSILILLICLPTTPVFLAFLKFSEDYFFWAWLLNMVASLVLEITIYHYAPPLLEKFTPLPAGELKTAIEAMAHSIGFPLTKIQVAKGSSQLSHNNICIYGSYRDKHIMLFDSLLENKSSPNRKNMKLRNNPEILAIVAHELGHWKLGHSIKVFVIQEMSSFLWFFLFSVLSGHKEPFVAFGFTDSQPAIIGFIIFNLLISPHKELLSFCLTVLSRRFEFQADAFACSLGKASELRSALIKLNKDNLGFPVADWLFSVWNYSHPPLLERLRALDNAKQD